MKISLIERTAFFFIAFSLICLFFSCSSTKKVKYFQDIPDSGQLVNIGKAEYVEPKVQVDDILNITIQTLSPDASFIINSANTVSGTGTTVNAPNYNQQIVSGYLVDKNGFIELPVIGKVKVLGLTTSEVKEVIRKAASVQFKVQSINVRYSNFKINITGEVNKPGMYIVPNEKVSLFDALAMAGDLTIYGKRENILLIRENIDGTKTPYRINLKKSTIMTEPYYYLRQNDLIYVEPSQSKAAATDAAQARNYTLIGSLLSVLIVFASRL